MNSLDPKRYRPEKKIQVEIENMLRMKEWLVIRIHGNLYQSGLPDLYATHKLYGHRWIEVKLPNMEGSHFTNKQLEMFPLLSANGTRIWILTGASDSEYNKLFKEDNWWTYYSLMKKRG